MRLRRFALVSLAVVGAALAAPGAGADAVDDGRKLLADGKPVEAAAAFKKALAAQPSSRAAMLGFAKAVAEGKVSDEYEAVGAALRAAIKAKPDDREARLALGDLYLAWMDLDERYRGDVQEQFGKVLEANPDDEEAVVGLARMYYASADHPRGLAALDAFLGRKPQSALALLWKGNLLYDQAVQTWQGNDRQWSDEVQDLFQKAYDAFEGSTRADGKRVEAWIKTAYAAQYLAVKDPKKRDAAAAAYEKVLDIDGDHDMAMRGLSALYAQEPTLWAEVLPRVAKAHAQAPIVHFYLGYQLQAAGKSEEAEKEYRTYVSTSKHPAIGWYQIGVLLAARGDEAAAKKAWTESLKADPRHGRAKEAVAALAKPLYARMKESQSDREKARALLKDFRALMDLAPTDIWLRNNVAFFFREAFGATRDTELLKGSVRAYEEASALIGEWRESYAALPYKDRHQMAQVLNDTGLMFQYYDETRDLKRAESYYRRAMEWTNHGYWDTYGNLTKILEAQQRWQDAYDFATACAEGLMTDENGAPFETGRATARGDALRYQSKMQK